MMMMSAFGLRIVCVVHECYYGYHIVFCRIMIQNVNIGE